MNWKTIIIIVLSLLVIETVCASTKKKKVIISGYVIDGNDRPLKDVAIFVDGQKSSKVTDREGFYKIKVKPNIKTLMVYSELNGGANIAFNGQRKIHFILAPNSE